MVLNSVGLAASTYHYQINKTKGKEGSSNRRGRKKPGYSVSTATGASIPDQDIKKIIETIVTGDGFPYGYKKINVSLQEDYHLNINHKKTYRLCKEMDVLRPQRKIYPKRPRKLAKREAVTASNQLWELDVKYGYIHGLDRFFFQVSLIDVFDRMVIDYHLGLTAKAKDACAVVARSLHKRGLRPGMELPIIRTDNGPQFTAKIFAKMCEALKLTHQRIPVKTPNMNAHIESFHSILEDECYRRNEFSSFLDVYQVISDYMQYYNHRRRHGSLYYKAPAQYFQAVRSFEVEGRSLVA